MWLKSCWIPGLAVLVLAASGCGNSGSSSSAPAGTSAATTGSPANSPAAQSGGDPTETVSAFLEAIRTGNDKQATALLSQVARQKAIESNRSPTPPASDTARFKVGDVKYVGSDGAQVACEWTDLDESGKPRTDKALWVCRHEPEGWRVVGVAAMVFEGEPPLLLNFEDPAEMAKKQEWLRQQVAARAKAQAQPPLSERPSVEAEKNSQDAFRR